MYDVVVPLPWVSVRKPADRIVCVGDDQLIRGVRQPVQPAGRVVVVVHREAVLVLQPRASAAGIVSIGEGPAVGIRDPGQPVRGVVLHRGRALLVFGREPVAACVVGVSLERAVRVILPQQQAAGVVGVRDRLAVAADGARDIARGVEAELLGRAVRMDDLGQVAEVVEPILDDVAAFVADRGRDAEGDVVSDAGLWPSGLTR